MKTDKILRKIEKLLIKRAKISEKIKALDREYDRLEKIENNQKWIGGLQ